MDKNMTVFQDFNLLIFHILPDVDNHKASLKSIVESLVRVNRLDYPNMDYTVLHSDGSMSYLIIHKHGQWLSFQYADVV